MRIISGLAGGIRLEVPQTDKVRPTEDKVKEALFSMLGDLTGKRVLDLFSGSGALGLEALSRGASMVLSVECEPRHIETIRHNLAAVQKAISSSPKRVDDSLPGLFKIHSGDAGRPGERLIRDAPFDIILADPPYHTRNGEFGAHELLLSPAYPALGKPGETILVLEHETSTRDLSWAPASSWELLKERSFGIRTISFARLISTP